MASFLTISKPIPWFAPLMRTSVLAVEDDIVGRNGTSEGGNFDGSLEIPGEQGRICRLLLEYIGIVKSMIRRQGTQNPKSVGYRRLLRSVSTGT